MFYFDIFTTLFKNKQIYVIISWKKNPETEPEPGELRNLEPPSTSASALVVDPGIPKEALEGHPQNEHRATT